MSFPMVRIGSVFDIRNGGTPSSSESSYWDGDVPWVTPADLGRLTGREIAEGERNITRRGLDHSNAQIVPAKSIILSIRAPIGHVALAARPMAFNQGCRGLIPRPDVDSRFGYYALLAHRRRLQAAGQGSTFLELSKARLASERIPLPDRETQRRIADFLDRETARIDGLIQVKKQLMGLVDKSETAMITAVMDEGWGLAKTSASNSVPVSDRNQQPNWIPLRRFVTEITNGTTAPQLEYADDVVPVTRIETISDGSINYGRVGYVAHSASLIRYQLVPGDVLFSHINSLSMIGNCAFYDGGRELFLGMNLLRLRPMDFVHPKFLYWCLRHPKAQNQIQQMAKPAINQASISISNLKRIQLPYYDLSIQVEIAELLDSKTESLWRFRAKVGESIDRLREFRAGLITTAVTGQIDVDASRQEGETERQIDRIMAGATD